MKKIVALALTVVMMLGLLAGCGEKPMDVQTLTQKMNEATQSVTAMGTKVTMDMDLSMAMTGMSMDVGLDLNMDMKNKLDMSAGYLKMAMGMQIMGQTQETMTETYVTSVDGKVITYAYDSATDMWLKHEQDAAKLLEMQQSLTGAALDLSTIPAEKMTLAPEKVTKDGKECYVLTVNVDGTYLKEYLVTLMQNIAGEEDQETEESLAILDKLDLSALNITYTYHVDASTFLIVELTGEILGMGEVLNELMSTGMGEAMMEEGVGSMFEGLDMTFDVPKFSILLNEVTYNDAVEIPAVPQEAIDNAVTEEEMLEDLIGGNELGSEPQADGSYLLSLENDAISVTIPEGFVVYVAEPEVVAAMTEDMMNEISYMLLPEYTDEAVRGEFDMTVDVLKDMELYGSHTEHEPISGYSVLDLVYIDGTMERYAWVETTDGVLMVTISASGEMPVEMETVLSGIVIGE